MGNILLSGFKLEPAEKAIADNIIKNYEHKLERFKFISLRLYLKQRPHSKHGKSMLYELKGTLDTGKRMSSSSTGLNLFIVLVEVLDKLLHEAEHKIKK